MVEELIDKWGKLKITDEEENIVDLSGVETSEAFNHSKLALVGVASSSNVNVIINNGEKLAITGFNSNKWGTQNVGGTYMATGNVDEMSNKGVAQRHPYNVANVPMGKNLPFGLDLDDIIGEQFHGNFGKIMEWLKSCMSSPIGVLGMGGVGKTTLLKHLHNHINEDPTWDAYWINVSQDCDLFGLQDKIAKAINEEMAEEVVEKRAARLHDILSKKGEIVLLFDDMWDSFEIKEVGIPLGKHCKIILSTRIQDVCSQMRCAKFVVQVNILSAEDTWKLFEKTLKVDDVPLARDVENLAREVAMECGSLPLAIIVVARSMRGVSDVREWENALNELRNPNIINCEMEKKVHALLKFSYDRINDEIMKRCFLSCVLYPEDYEIGRKDLIELWMGEGLLERMGGRKEQVCKGVAIINKLLNSCLLERITGNDKYVKVHDLIREMAIVITQKQPRFIAKSGLLLHEVPDHWAEDVINVSFCVNKIQHLPPDMSPNCPKLTTLMLDHNPLKEIPNSFFVHMHELSVLDLSWTKIKHLPENVSNLENLRALYLDGCRDLENVPCVKKLRKLRVLSLWYVKVTAPRGMEELEKLEVLRCRWSKSEWDNFCELMSSQFQRLSTFMLAFYYDISMELPPNPVFSEEAGVQIDGIRGEQDLTVLSFPASMESLCVVRCDFEWKCGSAIEDVLSDMSGLKKMKHLEFFKCKGLEYGWYTPRGLLLLNIIEKLELWHMPDLKGIIKARKKGETEVVAMPSYSMFSCLKYLELYGCPKIKVVFPAELLLHQQQQQPTLPNLESLSVKFCKEVEEIFEFPTTGIGNTNFILNLPNLKGIYLVELPNLRQIYGGLLIFSTKPCILKCRKLKRVSSLSQGSVCDNSESGLTSVQACFDNNAQRWEDFRKNHPFGAYRERYWDDDDDDDDDNYYDDDYYDDDDDDDDDDGDDDADDADAADDDDDDELVNNNKYKDDANTHKIEDNRKRKRYC